MGDNARHGRIHWLPEFICDAIPEKEDTDFPPNNPRPKPGLPSPTNGDASPKEPNKAEDKNQPPDEKPAD